MSRVSRLLTVTFFFTLVWRFLTIPVYAEADVACIGRQLGSYVSTVFDALGTTVSYGEIKLLSPAFNMTHPEFPLMVSTMAESLASKGYSFNDFYAVAGNAYNIRTDTTSPAAATVSDWVRRVRTTVIGNKNLILTETGWYPPSLKSDKAIVETGVELAKLPGMGVEAALLFNIFGNNPGFPGHALDDPPDVKNRICHGNCAKIGANSARFYSSSVDDFYGKAGSIGMGYTLEIGSDESDRSFPSLRGGIEAAHARGIIPIIRLGVGTYGSGFGVNEGGPEALARFIKDLDAAFDGPIYLIVGPNEPEFEPWATPGCDSSGDDDDDPGIIIGPDGTRYILISGQIRSSMVSVDSSTGGRATNRPISGAVVITYEGNGENRSGKSGDKLVKPVDWQVVKNGRYAIKAKHSSNTAYDGSNYFTVLCGIQEITVKIDEAPDGTPLYGKEKRAIIGDLYKVGAAQSIPNFNISVACPPTLDPIIDEETMTKPEDLPLLLRELTYSYKDEMLSCKQEMLSINGAYTNGQEVSALIDVYKMTDMYKGTHYGDSGFPEKEFNLSPESLEGRVNLKQKDVDVNAYRQIIASIIGSPYGELTSPKRTLDGKDVNELVSCEFIKECKKPIAESGDSGRNMQTCGGPGLNLAPPSYYKSLYIQIIDKIKNDIKKDPAAAQAIKEKYPICKLDSGTTVYLTEIAPPKDWGFDHEAHYVLGPEYMPYWSLALITPVSTGSGKFFQEPTDDSFKNTTAIPCRDTPFPKDTIPGRSKDAWGSCSISVYPSDATGQYAGALASFWAGTHTYSHDPEGGPPTAMLKSPIDPEAAANARLRLPSPGGIGIYRIGHVEPLCTCSNLDSECGNPTDSLQGHAYSPPHQKGLDELGDPWSAGYMYVTEKSKAREEAVNDSRILEFFRDPVDMKLFTDVVDDLFVVAKANAQNWATTWRSCVDFEPVAWCDVSSADCQKTETGYVQKTPGNAYTCESKIWTQLLSYVTVQRDPYQELAAGVLDFALPLTPPRIITKLWNIGTTDMVDVRASKEEFWKDKEGFGLENGKAGQTGGGVYFADYVRMGTSSPIISETKEGSGTGPDPDTGINCNPDASAPTGHNVKPVEALITALNNSSYRGNFSEANIRRCYNDLINTAKATGNDPAFIMATWVEESGASYYEKFGTVYDFGCEVNGWPPNNYRAQLQCATGLQSAYSYNANHQGCRDAYAPLGKIDVQKFMYIFAGGERGCIEKNYGVAINYPTQIKAMYTTASNGNNALNTSCVLPSTRWDSTCRVPDDDDGPGPH